MSDSSFPGLDFVDPSLLFLFRQLIRPGLEQRSPLSTWPFDDPCQVVVQRPTLVDFSSRPQRIASPQRLDGSVRIHRNLLNIMLRHKDEVIGVEVRPGLIWSKSIFFGLIIEGETDAVSFSALNTGKTSEGVGENGEEFNFLAVCCRQHLLR
jgi:hypothetical protein